MAKKYYYANVATDVVDYFDNELSLRDEIEIVSKTSMLSETGTSVIRYILKAEEGIINPKWELKR